MVTGLLIITACIFTSCGPDVPGGDPSILPASGLTLFVQPQTITYNTAGQVINFNYGVKNNGTTALPGFVTITDSKISVVLCPGFNTIGNKDNNLDTGEDITCAGGYPITQTDINAGVVSSTASATIGMAISNTVSTNLVVQENRVLSLIATPSTPNYSAAGQKITFTYTIGNTGAATLGPAQFVIRDDRLTPNPANCGPATSTLATNQTVTCTADYMTTSADAGVAQVTHTVNASGAGAGSVQPVIITLKNTAITTPNPSNIPRGSNQDHEVESGEWLLQISRCYGASYTAVRDANPQVNDPHWIYPGEIVRVPNVGSNGTIYGKPCIEIYPVVAGDTWQSIANAHNADIEVLMEANRSVTLTAGNKVKVPLNSRLSGTIPPTSTPPTQPIRLTFPAGNPTTVTQTGTIGTPATIRYVLNGTTGQILTVKLTVPTNDVSLAVYAPNGSALKPLDATNSWSGTLTANGDHFIDLVSTLGSTNKTYTLDVTLNTPAPASPFERVTDLYAGSSDSNPSHLSVFNNQLYFQANANDSTGAELWKYDGGLKAASRVADINPGAGGSEPAFLTQFGDFLYFRANGNDQFGLELWRLNTSGATGRVTDLNSGVADANPMYMTVFNNALYFSAKGIDGKGVELWKYDGTVATRVTDINPEAGDSNPAYLEVFNNALYFSASSIDGTGTELWKYDGTTATRAADINVGVGNSNPAYMTAFNNALYFSANADTAGTELWKFDGTTATRAADLNPAGDSIPTYLTVFNNALYFSASADAAGFEIWKYDGTNASRVSDLNTTGGSNPAYLTVYNNELYFQANGNDGTGAELWKFKGP